MSMNTGWVCPKCGRVYGPSRESCGACNAEIDARERVPAEMGDDLVKAWKETRAGALPQASPPEVMQKYFGRYACPPGSGAFVETEASEGTRAAQRETTEKREDGTLEGFAKPFCRSRFNIRENFVKYPSNK